MKPTRRKHTEGEQASFGSFMEQVEQTTDQIEIMQQLSQVEEVDQEPEPEHEQPSQDKINLPDHDFPAKPDMWYAVEVTKDMTKIWDKIHYKASFDQFLDIILAALERREDDYMSLIKGMDKNVLNAYAEIYGMLSAYFFEGNYGDPLGNFYMENFSHGKSGEYYTPWNVAYMMAQMLQPEPGQTVCDPTCGSGIMLLAARCIIHQNHGWLASSRYGRNLYGNDISHNAVRMAKINMYLTDYVYMICLNVGAVEEAVSRAKEQVLEPEPIAV